MKRTIITILNVLVVTLTHVSASEGVVKPNIILYVTDDQSPIAGCYGNTVIQTPHLDELAAQGTRFTQAFATTASCSASRSVILTGIHNHANGQYGHSHDYHKFSTFKSVAAISLPLQLSLNGYRTAQMGKYHIAPESVFHFDQYLKGRNPVGMAEGARALITAKDDRPFFLYLCTHSPHRGGGVDKRADVELKPNLFQNLPNGKHHKGVKEVFYKPKDVLVPAFLPDTPTCRAEIAQYYQSCSRIDQGLGRLIEILKSAGKWDNTILIFTADHGMAFPGAKTTVYDAGLRVPFVVRDPRQKKKGVVNHAMISHLDITPSILDMAGGYAAAKQAPKKLVALPSKEKFEDQGKKVTSYQGRSWAPILTETNPHGWDQITASHTFHEIQMYYPMRVIRDRKYKLIWNVAYKQPYPFATDLWAASTWQAQYQLGEDAKYGNRTVGSYINRPDFELYDIEKDPSESNNLASSPEFAETLKAYKAKLKKAQQETKDPWVRKWKYE